MSHINPIKILFAAAYPDDQLSLSSEYDEIVTKLKFQESQGTIRFLPISAETDYDKLITRITEEHPNVLHYSGHSTENGLCLKNSIYGTTQLIEELQLRIIFDKKSSEYLKLVFLNSCFSSNQAKIISEHGIYVLGIKNNEIEDGLAKKIAERFYLGLKQDPPVSMEKAILSGCFNFTTTYPKHANLISLWKDGREIDYKTIYSPILPTKEQIKAEEPIEIDNLKQCLLQFNFAEQLKQVSTRIKSTDITFFTFDENSKEEMYFIYKIIENERRNNNSFCTFLKISTNFNDINSQFDNYIKDTEKYPVVLYTKLYSKNDTKCINKIIEACNNKQTKGNALLFFIFPSYYDLIIKEEYIIQSSALPENKRSEKYISAEILKLEKEFENLFKLEVIKKIGKQNEYNCFFSDYTTYIANSEKYKNSDRKYVYTFIKELTQQIGYEIEHEFTDNSLNLNLIPCNQTE